MSQATISCRHHEGSRTTEIFFLQNAYNINKSMGVMSDAEKKRLFTLHNFLKVYRYNRSIIFNANAANVFQT